ncbi:Cadherin 88C [Carabus blaptoides fortunei]
MWPYNELSWRSPDHQRSTNQRTLRRLRHWRWMYVLVLLVCGGVQCNRPPRFLIDGQTEIVLRLKEGEDTPVGSMIYRLRGIDPDGDKLRFGVRTAPASDVIRVESISASEADIYLNKELDREMQDEYALVLTLTDGRLGEGNFITQSLLLLVEDVNDNTPVFLSYQPSINLREDAQHGVIAALEATDADEGAYGQVVYQLEELDAGAKKLFSISTVGGRGVIRLIGKLDYERRTLHQLRVLAVDRAKQGRVNTAIAPLLINVQDVEDQPPEFVRVTPVARVSEDAPVGTSVLQVTAIDGDRGVNNRIAYSLSPELGSDNFLVNPLSGIVSTARLLDREDASVNSGAYILKIIATEVAGRVKPAPNAVTEITVMVTDVNDETPAFKSAKYECEIAENAQTNTPLTFLNDAVPEVYDYDQGKNGTFKLFLRNDDRVFDVTPATGINEASFLIRVREAEALDYERTSEMNFTLIAREVVEMDPKSSEVEITVYIRDVNDNFPEFIQPLYEVSVAENCEAGTTIAWVQALDEDSGNYGTRGVRYTNLAGSIEDLLYLHPVSGIITVKTSGGPSWDRELVSRHYLTVEARDDLGHGNRNTVQLIVNIQDVNDNAPVFIQNKYEARLKENDRDFEMPLKIEARDADLNGTKNSQVEYYIVEGDYKQNFTINPLTGVIVPTKPLDFEQLIEPSIGNVQPLSLSIRARDNGTPSLSTTVPVVIYLQDINDHAPKFDQVFYSRSIAENAPGGTPVLDVRAFDNDGSSPNNRIVYRIQSGASDKFVIDADSGVISVAYGATLDPDLVEPRQVQYSLNVVALDGAAAQLRAAVMVNITVLDVNNKPPVFVNPGVVHIQENTLVGTLITQVLARDLDAGAILRYKLDPEACEARTERGTLLKLAEHDYLSAFRLDPADGTLSVAKLLDRETVEVLKLALIVEDIASATGQQTASTVLTVIVEDVNDNNPKFRRPFYRFAVTENSKNGVSIGSVVADDADKNRTITYGLEGSAEVTEMLHLDVDTGDIVVANKIDHEQFLWLNLSVRAMDSGIPARYRRAELFIQVLDENDNNPFFLPEPRALSIPEDVPVGEQVAMLEARDADAGEYGRITYLLDRVSSQGMFSLESDTGILKVSAELDRETRSSYLLVVEAWDNYQYGFSSGESRNAFKQINVTILDANDNPPQIILPPGCVTITEFHEEHSPITFIHVSDPDNPATPNGRVIMDIVAGNTLGLFALEQTDEWIGELFAVKSLKGRHGNYSLLVRAEDLGTPHFSSEALLHVCVADFNDHAPVFTSPPHNTTLRVPENATVGSALVQVTAEDDDVGANGAVRYRLKPDPAGHWRAFNLQPVSGVLELRLPLNRTRQKIFDIRIEAYDLGTPTPLSSDLDLTIYVTNINDYQPQFLVDEVALNFTENEVPGMEIRLLPPTMDRDELEFEGPLPTICYYIVGGNEYALFYLNHITHELRVTAELDREEQPAHLLLVKASEDCNNQPTNQSFFEPSDDTLLKVVIHVVDVNDNPPQFVHRIFTGGVSTGASFGTEFMSVKATDSDADANAIISYYLIGNVQMTLTEGLEHLQRAPFLVDKDTGGVQLNFDPQQGMKGYFDFVVLANDTGGLQDTARVFIYLLREDQRVRFVLRQHPPELRHRIDAFREVLGNVTGAIVNVDEFRVHVNHDGTIDKTRTDLYLHLVDKHDHSILEVPDVLKLVDQNTEKLDGLFKEFNVLDTQPGGPQALSIAAGSSVTFWLTAASLFLALLLFLCLALCVSQRQTYQRKLKAATTTAYVAASSDLGGRGLSALSGRVPNTNKHSVEGSNPIWLRAYENEWYKHADDFSQGSELDSLDENVISSGDGSQFNNHDPTDANSVHNVYQTLQPPGVTHRKLETTEL